MYVKPLACNVTLVALYKDSMRIESACIYWNNILPIGKCIDGVVLKEKELELQGLELELSRSTTKG